MPLVKSHSASRSDGGTVALLEDAEMSNRLLTLTTAVITLLTLGTASAIAAEPVVVRGAKTTGAMVFETQGRATDETLARRQGGFAVPGGVHWIRTPAPEITASASAF